MSVIVRSDSSGKTKTYTGITTVALQPAVGAPITINAADIDNAALIIVDPVMSDHHTVQVTVSYADDVRNHWKEKATLTGPDGRVIEAYPVHSHMGFYVQNPGTYTISVSDGGTESFVVPASTRKLVPLAQLASGTEVHLGPGTFKMPSTANLTDVVVIGAGDSTVVQAPLNANALNFSNASSGITYQNLKIDGGGSVGTVYGDDIAFVDVHTGSLNMGFLVYASDCFMSGIRTDKTVNQCIFGIDMWRGTVVHSVIGRSNKQSPIRFTIGGAGTDGAKDFFCYDVTINHTGIACVTDRFGSDQRWDSITCNGANFSIIAGGAEPGSLPTTVKRVLVTNCKTINGKLEISTGAQDVIVRNCTFQNGPGECASISVNTTNLPEYDVKAILLDNVVGISTHSFKFYGAPDAKINNSTLVAPINTPFCKNSLSQIVNPGVNNKVQTTVP